MTLGLCGFSRDALQPVACEMAAGNNRLGAVRSGLLLRFFFSFCVHSVIVLHLLGAFGTNIATWQFKLQFQKKNSKEWSQPDFQTLGVLSTQSIVILDKRSKKVDA
jgi:hypothetical protein